jgi:hypothetical protein
VSDDRPPTRPRSAEEWLAEVEAIVAGYRAGRSEPTRHKSLTRDEAVTRLRRLGVSWGDADRWLGTMQS